MSAMNPEREPPAPQFAPPPGLAEFEVAEIFQISARGAVALGVSDPWPWWPVATHRVRITPPAGAAFEAGASVESLRSRAGSDRMALLLVHVQQAEVPVGSRIRSLGYTPHPNRPVLHGDVLSPFGTQPFRRWWQFWKRG